MRNAVEAFRETGRNAVEAFRETGRNAVEAFRQTNLPYESIPTNKERWYICYIYKDLASLNGSLFRCCR
jgi:hypothetical protein